MRNFFILVIQFLFILIAFTVSASAGVVVFDEVIPVNKTIKLKALTKGRFLSEGGKLVTFYAGEKKIGTTLSGGDGYAFLKYSPSTEGIINLKVEAGEEADEGVLLITGKKDMLILIEIESSLFESIISRRPVKGGKEALQKLSKDFRIVYLTSLLGIKQSRNWLKDNEFILSPVLKWEGAETVDALKERGIPPYAIIGAPGMLSEVPDINKRFSFDEAEDATEVNDWKDLLKHLDRNEAK